MDLDQVRLNFSPAGLTALNAVLALVMFGIALDLDVAGFRRLREAPRAAIAGLVAQFIAFPAATWLLIRLLHPAPSVALGMLLISACPGGNMSNFLTHLAKGNTALSISLTALSTAAALFFTPANLAFWGALDPGTAALLRNIRLDPVELFTTFFIIILFPLAIGRFVATRAPDLARKLRTPMKVTSIAFFVLFVAIALRLNWESFQRYVVYVAGYVALQDTIALALGYALAASLRLPEADRRAIAMECGIRNSGLGLILIFKFFDGLGGMAIVAAWWGVWHILSGLLLATAWARFGRATPTVAT